MDTVPPRVLHVITPSRMAGAETFLARLMLRVPTSLGLHRCMISRSEAVRHMQAAGVPVQIGGIGGKANLLALPRLAQAARAFDADLLHSHLSSASWWCGWHERFGGRPSIGHVHGFTSAAWHRGQTHLIACSQAVRRDLIAKGVAEDQITVLHYPVDSADTRPRRSRQEVRAELGVDLGVPVVGTFAHLSVKKGYRELVVAAQTVLRRCPATQFWCFGDGDLREELAQQSRAAGIADRFRLLGFRDDVPDLMRAVDVMALPSHSEPFGLVYVEAALCERPVIACNAGGAPEIVEPGETGLLVPPRDSAALAEAILELLDNRARAAAMGRRGRELAVERFPWDRYLQRLHELYRRVRDEAVANKVAA